MMTLTYTVEEYSRTASGKGWKAAPETSVTETMPWNGKGEALHNAVSCLETLRFFRNLGGTENATKSFTGAGLIVTRLVSTNPDRTRRVIRTFRIS